MCGRMNIHDQAGISWLLNHLGLTLNATEFEPHYNVAPGAAVKIACGAQQPQLSTATWGIMPNWADPQTFKRPLTNARAETIWQKPSFKQLIRTHRCIIPANGFYEWKREGGEKTPYYIHAKTDPAMAFAGIYQTGTSGEIQCCVITTQANAAIQEIHHRMPVMLGTNELNDWLSSADVDVLDHLMRSRDDCSIAAVTVSSHVNHAGHNDKLCMQPASAIQPSLF